MGVLVGREAPDFTAAAVLGNGEIVGDFNLKSVIKGKTAVVFFYPLDFTFVCPSELIAFDHRLQEFSERGVEVIGISIDSQFTHNAWPSFITLTPLQYGQGALSKVPPLSIILIAFCVKSFGNDITLN